MSADIDLAQRLGMRYAITSPGTEELHGTVREIQAFADAMVEEREKQAKVPQSGYGPGFDAFDGMGYDLN